MVEGQVADIHARLRNQHQVGIFGRHGNVGGIGELTDVNAAGFQLQKTDGAVRNGPENQLVQVRPAFFIPVIGVFLQKNLVILYPFDELERAGSHRVSNEFLGVFQKGCRADDIGQAHSHICQKRGFNLFQFENDGVLVNGFDAVHGTVHFHGRPVFRGFFLGRDFPAFTEKLELRLLHLPAQGKDDSIGIERGSVMEFDAFSQVKGVGFAVGGDVPGFRKPRFNCGAFIRIVHQGFEHVVADHE